VDVARRWARAGADTEVLLAWLHSQAARALREALGAQVAGPVTESTNQRLQKPPKPINIRPRLDRLRLVEDIYRNRSKPINAELQFTALLQSWYGEAAGGDGS
jgi:hypothetical protein